MTHDPDRNITMPFGREADVAEYLVSTGKTFDEVLDAELDQAERWLMGEGFVMAKPTAPREVWPGIEDGVRELEALLRSQ